MHLVIVGGAGFIGQSFVDAALAAGHSLTLVGRSPTPPSAHAQLDYLGGGLDQLAASPDLLARADLICHFATATTPTSSNDVPLLEIAGNLVPTVKLLEAMRRSGNRRILFLSSGGAVYGAPRFVPIDEDHPVNPISPYGVVKVAIENFLRMYEANYEFKATIVRPSNPYGVIGKHPRAGGALETFVRAAVRGTQVTVWGDGSTVRDYVHVSDLVGLILAAAEREVSGTFNCGSGHGTSLLELIAAIENVTGRNLERRFEPPRNFDPPTVVLDIARSKRSFDWAPRVSLNEGITLTVLAMQALRS